METMTPLPSEKVNILVVGNNPIELSRVFDSLKHVSGKNTLVEYAFDLKSISERLLRFKPDYIVLDDNMGKAELRNTIKTLNKDRKTKSIPITVLKNSNYDEAISFGVLNFILKENISGESLYTALKNSLKNQKTQLMLYTSYAQRKGQLLRMMWLG